MNVYKVWIEVEEVDDEGNPVRSWSAFLEGAAIAVFDTSKEAIEYGNQVQREAPVPNEEVGP